MARTPLNLEGFRSGKLVGLKRYDQNSLKQWRWLCLCDCGNTHVVLGARLKDKHAQSCGQCGLKQERHPRTHGLSRTPEWNAYMYAKTRCTNPNTIGWKHYGGRGIKFLFTSFEQFLADIGPKPSPKHTVDRINNHGHYEPGNVRWATKSEQLMNRRPVKPIPRDPKTKRFLKKELWPA
jgi:hypothetical protein